MPTRPSPERAEILGLEALAWLAARPGDLDMFLRESGVSGTALREAAGSPGLAVAVLDFLLAREALLAEFCENNGTGAAELHQARHALAPDTGWSA